MITQAFIFARGGSKKLKKKNIKLLNGKPLIQYSIEIELQSSLINKIFVSTDENLNNLLVYLQLAHLEQLTILRLL